jgi:dihydrofolate reductase
MSTPKVAADISMSLDGFVTGPDADLDNGLGTGGEALHTWAMSSDDEVDAQVLKEAVQNSGSVVMGRRLFDIIDGPKGWNDEVGYGGEYATSPPFFVVTHAAPESVRLDLDFTFVTGGLPATIDQAKGAAGDKEVVIMGGGDVIRQSLDLGLIDELRIHLAPIVLGGGTPLFAEIERHELIQASVRVSSNATHLTYQVKR